MGVRRTGRVEAADAFALLDPGDVLGRDEAKCRRRIDEAPDQPGGRAAIDPDRLPGHPLHRAPPRIARATSRPSCSCARMDSFHVRSRSAWSSPYTCNTRDMDVST